MQKGFAGIFILIGILAVGLGAAGAWYAKIIQIPNFPPPGCHYQQVQCIKAPCNPVLTCGTPLPSPVVAPQVTPSPIPSVSSAPTGIGEMTNELQGFPIYPNAIYLGKQPIVPCTNGAEENGFSTCNAVVYSWKTPDDYDKVTSWYREGGSGWICGGAGSYDGPRSAAGGGNTCTKNNRRFGTFFDATAQETKIDFALYP